MLQRQETIGDCTLYLGDCLDVMRELPDNSVDSIVTDPPYGLSKEPDAAEVLRHWLAGDDYKHRGGGFMGKEWDSFVPGPTVWKEALRVLKPGGHCLSFFGTRTYDLGVMALRLAGFEIRDRILTLNGAQHWPVWVTGQGFPKSLDVSKAIDKAAGAERDVVAPAPYKRGRANGSYNETRRVSYDYDPQPITAPATAAAKQWQGWGTALKPAHEPICVARKPLGASTVAANVLEWGTGAINVDGCRVDGRERTDYGLPNAVRSHGNTYGAPSAPADFDSSKGRFPANVIHDGSPEVLAGFPQSKAGTETQPRGTGGIWSAKSNTPCGPQYGDTGSAARFFYCAKANRSERFSYLTCNCETMKLCSWVKQDQNQGAETGFTSQDPDTFAGMSTESSHSSMLPYGSENTDLSQGDTESITSTATSRITASKTCRSLLRLNINESTEDANSGIVNGSNHAVFAGASFQFLQGTFICPQKDGRFTGVVVNATSPLLSGKNICEGCGSEVKKTSHPTQKPTDLMRYLVRLVTPAGGIVLDPFMGSGSTGKAARLEGFRFAGIEIDEAYFEIAMARVGKATAAHRSEKSPVENKLEPEPDQLTLFEDVS